MSPYEIMLSESQERMLLVVKHGREREVEAIFDKWDLHAAHIGFVTDDGLMRVKDGERWSRDPEHRAVDDAPVYNRPTSRPAHLDTVVSRISARSGRSHPPMPRRSVVSDDREQALGLSPCDHMVRTNTLVLAGMGAVSCGSRGRRAGAGDVHRRQRPSLLSRSPQGRDAGSRRGCSQRGLRRCASDRHQLPQLRQS